MVSSRNFFAIIYVAISHWNKWSDLWVSHKRVLWVVTWAGCDDLGKLESSDWDLSIWRRIHAFLPEIESERCWKTRTSLIHISERSWWWKWNQGELDLFWVFGILVPISLVRSPVPDCRLLLGMSVSYHIRKIPICWWASFPLSNCIAQQKAVRWACGNPPLPGNGQLQQGALCYASLRHQGSWCTFQSCHWAGTPFKALQNACVPYWDLCVEIYHML